MSHVWPSETAFRRVDLDVKDRDCGLCDTPMHVCSQRRLFTFEGPWLLVVKLVHCPDPDCPGHRRTISSPEEMAIALPRLPQDNLDLERWFRRPKGHERRIHGRRHAGVRLVYEGPTLALTLDAHLQHPEPFTAADLAPYRSAQPPHSPQAATARAVPRVAPRSNVVRAASGRSYRGTGRSEAQPLC